MVGRREDGAMDRDRVLATLRPHESDLKRAGIVRLSLFGSVVRGDAGPDSDLDLLAASDETRQISLMDVAGFEIEEKKVGQVDTPALSVRKKGE
jgi:hypothetical protein